MCGIGSISRALGALHIDRVEREGDWVAEIMAGCLCTG
jgi:hypothetical protein